MLSDDDFLKKLAAITRRKKDFDAGKVSARKPTDKPSQKAEVSSNDKDEPPPQRQKIEIDYVPLIRGHYDLTDDFIQQNAEQIVAWETRARACERCNGLQCLQLKRYMKPHIYAKDGTLFQGYEQCRYGKMASMDGIQTVLATIDRIGKTGKYMSAYITCSQNSFEKIVEAVTLHLQKLGLSFLQCKTQNTLDANAASRTPCLFLTDATADKLPEQKTVMGILSTRHKTHVPTLIISVRTPVDFADFGFSDGKQGIKIAEYIADTFDIVDISKEEANHG